MGLIAEYWLIRGCVDMDEEYSGGSLNTILNETTPVIVDNIFDEGLELC